MTLSFIAIDHEQCRPEKWTAEDLLTLSRYVHFGHLDAAGSLTRLGISIVHDDRHTREEGSNLEHVGFALNSDVSAVYSGLRDLFEVADGDGIEEVCKIFRGPTQYAVAVPVPLEEGDVDYDFELKATEKEAESYAETMCKVFDDEPGPDASGGEA